MLSLISHQFLSSNGEAPELRLRRLLEGQNEILELIARGLPTSEVLDRLTAIVEELAPPALCSVLFVESGKLWHGAARSLPEHYCQAINGLEIGPKVGSCGTAAHLRAPVVVRDIATDPLWEDYRDLVLPLGLRACWSQPILTEDGGVLGTFALYYREPREPVAEDWQLLEGMAKLTRVLLERDDRKRVLGERVVELEQTRERLQHKTDELQRLAIDLTHARNEAATASRMKSEFLANMSHELRTPLNAIIGFSDIMAAELLGPMVNDQYRDYARDIRDSGQHLLQIISEVLDISRIEAGRFELAVDTVDLGALVDACLRLMAERARAAGLRLDSRQDRSLPKLRADEIKIKQVLLNLVSNAVKFTPRGGKVAIDTRLAADGGIEIAVTDTGIGMTVEQIPIALEPFRQIDNAFSRKYQGTGLGLPLAKSIVELHGGCLTIVSSPGQGTCVTATFPSKMAVAAS